MKDAPVETFLERHWSRPAKPQGVPPAHLDPEVFALDAAACGRCHAAQFEDWRASRHARAMGPGVYAQLLAMPAHDRDQHEDCIRCHAPLAEQADALVRTLACISHHPTAADADPLASRSGEKCRLEGRTRTDGKRGLHREGLVCAGCHVRGYRWYGPARADGSVPGTGDGPLPHGGWTASAAFEDARFCSACHQFDDDGFALNGKLLENTYAEWLQSRYARQGITCQNCHMPGRRHLWRGIHDPGMVRSAVSIHTLAPRVEDGEVVAELRMRNTGAGHHFPTYVTPAVLVEGVQRDAHGRELDATRRTRVIARKIPLNLSEELFDTRIPPEHEFVFAYRVPREAQTASVAYRVIVEPDAFYAAFFTALLAGDLGPAQSALMDQARSEARSSSFVIHTSERRLAKIPVPALAAIPAGEFVSGSDRAERDTAYALDSAAYGHDLTRENRWYENERERGVRTTSAYAISTTPITNRQYAAFVAATGHPAPDVERAAWDGYGLIHPYSRTRRHAWSKNQPPEGREEHPVVLVSYADAQAYADWLSLQTGHTWRLPGESEWERAVRGDDGRRFPWGEPFDANALNSHDAGPFDTRPVGAFASGRGPHGLLDGAGQVFEWIAKPPDARRAWVKGGSWDDSGCGVCRPAARHARPVDIKHILIGFRLVRE